MKHHRGLGIGGEFAPLLALLVGVEDEAAFVEALEQHHAHIRQAVGPDGCQRHRVGIGGLAPARVGKPTIE